MSAARKQGEGKRARGPLKEKKKRTWLMPQEVEVWYVLPAIRRELTKVMIEKGIAQKQIASMLGVTEPAITQYKLEKSSRSRGDQITIPREILPEIERAAETMIAAWDKKAEMKELYETMTREINRIIRLLRDSGALCDIHRSHCEHVDEECDACKSKS
ncbi:MAG: hypothetical protein HXY34_08630 [Candidatus Thorarchaeota archaeon]|nr:hypothetical protein [Candidatus Thorarchaeota archaeon]